MKPPYINTLSPEALASLDEIESANATEKYPNDRETFLLSIIQRLFDTMNLMNQEIASLHYYGEVNNDLVEQIRFLDSRLQRYESGKRGKRKISS